MNGNVKSYFKTGLASSVVIIYRETIIDHGHSHGKKDDPDFIITTYATHPWNGSLRSRDLITRNCLVVVVVGLGLQVS